MRSTQRVCDRDELVRDSDDDDLMWLTSVAKPACEGLQDRVVMVRNEGSLEQDMPQ